jgi:chitodextrinase
MLPGFMAHYVNVRPAVGSAVESLGRILVPSMWWTTGRSAGDQVASAQLNLFDADVAEVVD